jgi:hypothetical protein
MARGNDDDAVAEEGTEHAQHLARGDDDDDAVAEEGTEHALHLARATTTTWRRRGRSRILYRLEIGGYINRKKNVPIFK